MDDQDPTFDMGCATSAVFAGHGVSAINRLLYAQTAPLFAEQVRSRLPATAKPYRLLDIGTFKGELLGNILEAMPEYRFQTVGIDIDERALNSNGAAEFRILGSADRIPLGDRSVDLAISRYVLQWNDPERQKEILHEVSRTIRHFSLLTHNGPEAVNAADWRGKQDLLFTGVAIPRLKRHGCFFASPAEIEQWLDELGIPYDRLDSRTLEGVDAMYQERYALDAGEAAQVRSILGDHNYVAHSDWILYPQP